MVTFAKISFSKLKLIKSSLILIILQERLRGLTILSIKNEILVKF
jgi:hypothetical protein